MLVHVQVKLLKHFSQKLFKTFFVLISEEHLIKKRKKKEEPQEI